MQLQACLLELETRLLQPEVRSSEQTLLQLLAEDFVEFGASGIVWTRTAIIQVLAQEPHTQRSLSDFKLTPLSADTALVTYRSHRHATSGAPAAHALRSSIWKLNQGNWQLLFHQGTPTAA